MLVLVFTLLCGQSKGFWPFSSISVHAATDAEDIVYLDRNAKRVAIIGMSNLIISSNSIRNLRFRVFSVWHFHNISLDLEVKNPQREARWRQDRG